MKVSIIGLGIIGQAWAANLFHDEYDLRTWNRTPKDFNGFEPDIRKCAQGAEFIIIVVADPPAVQSVMDQIVPVLRRGQTVIQSSTISAEWSRKFAAQVQETGAAFLEAPFTGSKPAAEQRKTVFYVGGEDTLLEHCRPLLERLSNKILHIGPVGSASSLKLAMNVNIAGVAQALSESLTLARAEGISDDTFFAALAINASHSGVADLKEPKLRASDFSPQFSIKHMTKDLRLARETAQGNNLELPEMERLLEIYDRGIQAGWSEDDFIGLIRLIQRK